MHERSPRAREPGGADAAAAAREFRFIALCRESKRGVGKTMCVCVWGVKGIAAENGGDFGDFGDFGDGGRSFPRHHPTQTGTEPPPKPAGGDGGETRAAAGGGGH